MDRRCQTMTVKDMAQETPRAWWIIRGLEMAYMREPLCRTGQPALSGVGIDEISIRKGHTYRIVVSDLERRRPIASRKNTVALGFVEGPNNRIRVMPRRSNGLRNEEYLRLKVLTCMLAPI